MKDKTILLIRNWFKSKTGIDLMHDPSLISLVNEIEALRIHDVVEQSELLKAFVEWQIQGNTPYAGMFIDEHIRAYFKSL